MIKRVGGIHDAAARQAEWLDLKELADVDVTSEDPAAPIEGAFAGDASAGWVAGAPGVQTVRLRFHRPLALRRIRVVFEETGRQRTQEFVLRYRADQATSDADVVRQQFTFSPGGASVERETYAVNLDDVVALELSIVPDIGGGSARAKLKELRVA
jgi:hypothetical protein